MEPKDARQCRINASRCAVLAAKAENNVKKNTYLTLAKRWEELAIELERLDKNEAEPAMQRYAS